MGVVVALLLVIAFGSCMLFSFFANDEQDVFPLPLVFSLVTFFRSRFKLFQSLISMGCLGYGTKNSIVREEEDVGDQDY
jgi:hypothetical protein